MRLDADRHVTRTQRDNLLLLFDQFARECIVRPWSDGQPDLRFILNDSSAS